MIGSWAMKRFLSFLYRETLSLIVLLFAVAVFNIWGCSQLADSISATTGRVYNRTQLQAFFPNQQVFMGDLTFAEVNPAFAGKWHDYTGSLMSMLGMAANWSVQFDCNRFATAKMAVIDVRFLVDTWNKSQPANGPAAAEFWYIPGAAPGGYAAVANVGKQGHAIIVDIENGQKTYRDIYTPNKLTLTPAEEQSAYMIKF